MGINLWGNYCGPGWTGGKFVGEGEAGNYDVQPFDALDGLCRDHDRAYETAEAARQAGDIGSYWQQIIAADQALLRDIGALIDELGPQYSSGDSSVSEQFFTATKVQAVFIAKQQFWNKPNRGSSPPPWADARAVEQFLWDKFPLTSGAAQSFMVSPISSNANGKWRESITYRPRDPLAIDLDGDGIETVGIGSNPIVFDHNADGIKTGTGWVKADDAWLALDRDGNGSIDTGRELFGVDTQITVNGVTRNATSGFEALSALDANADGSFSAADAEFANVRLWQDTNQDGVSQSTELVTLAQAGITAIGLTPSGGTVNLGNGNSITGQAVVTRTSGDTTVGSVGVGGDTNAGNLNLADNPFYREFTDPVPLTETAQDLPEMGGSGWVRDLREAMSLGTPAAQALSATVAAFVAATTRDAQMALLDQLLLDWARTNQIQAVTAALFTTSSPANGTIDPNAGLTAQLSKVLPVLEVFNGQALQGSGTMLSITTATNTVTGQTQQVYVLNGITAPFLQAYDALRDSVYSALVVQTRLQPYLDSIELVIDEDGIQFDTSALSALLATAHAADPRHAFIELTELHRYASATLQAVGFGVIGTIRPWIDALAVDSPIRAELTGWGVFLAGATAGSAATDLYLGDGAGNTFSGGEEADILDGADGADALYGGVGADVLIGGAGNDGLYGDGYYGGSGGSDVLDGGAGNDTLVGGFGSDTYLFGRGDGQDTLNNDSDGWNGYADPTPGKLDTLQFKAGVAVSDVTLTRTDVNLVLKINGTSDQITISSYFSNDGVSARGWAVEQIRFDDGTTWNVAAVKGMLLQGTANADSIVGYASGDTMAGLAGGDTLYGNGGDDALDGGADNDILYGGVGADSLVGGDGNDGLYGDGYWGGSGGNDVLDGGVGNDTLVGGFGSDTYLFGRGDGQDYLDNDGERYNGTIDPTAGKIDTLQLKAGVAVSDVTLSRTGDNLAVKIIGTTDQVTVYNYFANDGTSPRGWAVEQIRFDDGTTWDTAAVKATLLVGATAGNDTIVGYATDDAVAGLAGADTLSGRDGADALDGGDGGDTLNGENGNDTLLGGNDNDALYGGVGADTLVGGEGNDGLYGDGYWGGSGGSDVLDGGAGNDTLVGGFGSDTYLFGRGDGQDYLDNDGERYNATIDPTAGKIDTLQFKAGVATSDVTLSRTGDNLIVKINGTTDHVTVFNYFANDGTSPRGWAVEQIHFNDGTTWNVATVKAMILATPGNDVLVGYATDDTMMGLGGNDTLSGRDGADTLDGGDGGDTLNGENGNDTLLGGNDNDTLYGGVGADTLVGGAGSDGLYGDGYYGGSGGNDVLDGGVGNDTLAGGFGSDTYLFGRGDGQDYLDNDGERYNGTMDPTVGKLDTLQLKAGVAVSDVTLSRTGDNLIVKIIGTTDQVTIFNYFANDATSPRGWAIEQVRFDDGTTWDIAAVKAMMLVGATAGNDTIVGYATNDTVNGLAGADTLSGRDGADTLDGGDGGDTLNGENGNDTLLGGNDNDTLYGGVGADTLVGGAGNDGLYGDGYYGGSGGNDVLDGGAGNDSLAGGFGSDTYLFGRGDGQDYLDNDGERYNGTIDPTVGKIDTLQLKAGVAVSEVALSRTGDNLTVKINGTTDQVTIFNYFANDATNPRGWAVEQIRFDDGTIWNVAAVKAMMLVGATAGNDTIVGYATNDTVAGLAGADTLSGRDGADTLDGGDGGDTLNGENGNDTLLGGNDNDTLYGGVGADMLVGGAGNDGLYGDGYYGGSGGNDVLDGGAGNDTLAGGFGSDTYLFGRGDGQDYLDNDGERYNGTIDPTVGKIDTLQLKAGVAVSDVTLSRTSDNLIVKINGTTDQVTVFNYFAYDATSPRGWAVEQIRFDDGTTWNIAAVKAMVLQGTAANDTIVAYASADALSGGAGNDTLSGRAGNDTLNGGDGSDALYGEGDADVLDGGAGNDSLAGGTGNNTYVFGRGSGVDTVANQLDNTAGKINTLKLGPDIAPSQIELKPRYSSYWTWDADLEIAISGTTDKITFGGGWRGATGANDYATLQRIEFADGTVWDLAAIQARVFAGTPGADTYSGGAAADTMFGQAGADTIRGSGGNDAIDGGTDGDLLYGDTGMDSLVGGDGADGLYGGADNDTLEGGIGNDSVNGEQGNDLHLFGRGDGQDVLYTNSGSAGDVNTLRFKPGVAPGEITFKRVYDPTWGGEYALELGIAGTTDKVIVRGIFYGDTTTDWRNPLQRIEFDDGTAWDLQEITNRALAGTAGADTLRGLNGADTLNAGAGNDVVWGLAGNDVLAGETGDDTLNAGAGTDTLTGGDGADGLFAGADSDVLDGGAGNDSINGEQGNDLYLFGRGDGQDVLYTNSGSASDTNTLRFKAGVAPGEITFKRVYDPTWGGDYALELGIAGTTDKVIVRGIFYNNTTTDWRNPLQRIEFDDGTVWNLQEITNRAMTGTSGADTLLGTNSADTIIGHGGNDTLTGGAGNDSLNGGEGNDTLAGGAGNDTYLMDRGFGAELIQENDATSGNTDVAQFMAGISSDQIWMRRIGNDLEVSVIGTADKMTVQSWYVGAHYRVEQFKTSDGLTLLDSKVQDLVSAMAGFAPPAAGQTTLPENYQASLTPVIAASWGS